MTVAVLHDDVETLTAEWRELFAHDDEATPFQSPGWAQACLRFLPGNARPWTLAVRDAGRLVGLAPLVRRRVGSFRVLQVLGEQAGDYWDVLARPDDRAAVRDAVALELHRRRDEWDLAVIARLPASSATPSALARCGMSLRHRAGVAYPGIELPSTFDAYLEMLPSKRRTDLRRRLRDIDDGVLEVREVAAVELRRALRGWQAIRARQWGERGRLLDPLQASDRFREFLADALAAVAPEGLATVWEFVRDGQVVGVYINLHDRRAFYQYLGGFDPDLAHMAIGKIATAHGIRSSIEAGRSYYDFTRGGEPYKYAFGAVDRISSTVVLTSDRIRSRAAFTLSSSALTLTTFGRTHAPGRVRAIARPVTRRLRERR